MDGGGDVGCLTLTGRLLVFALLAIHGDQDGVVAPRNAAALVRQTPRFETLVVLDAAGEPASAPDRNASLPNTYVNVLK